MSTNKKLEFDAATHTYTLDGEVVPSATQLVEQLYPFDPTVMNQTMLEQATERGTKVHKDIEILIESDINVSDEESRPYIESFQEWSRQFGLERFDCECEKMVCNEKNKYAGTVDLILNEKPAKNTFSSGGESERWIIDFKTTSSINVPKVGIQLALYAEAIGLVEIEPKIGVLHLYKKDGHYGFKFYDLSNSIRIFLEQARNLVSLFNYKKQGAKALDYAITLKTKTKKESNRYGL